MSQKIKNNQIKFIEIIFYMMKINKNKNIKKLTNVCLLNNLETIGRNYTKKNKCIINGMIRRKTSQKSKKFYQISTYILCNIPGAPRPKHVRLLHSPMHPNFFVTSLARPDHVRLLQPDAPQPLTLLRPFILGLETVRFPTHHPSPSIHIGWVVASGNRTPNLTFNTSDSPADATSSNLTCSGRGALGL